MIAVIRCQDGSIQKVDLDVACAQSKLMQSLSESIHVSDGQSQYSTVHDIAPNEVLIDLSQSMAKDYLTGPFVRKICRYWTHFGTEASHQPIEKPIRPTMHVQREDGMGYDPQKVKQRANLWLMVPPWFARFATEEFPDRESLC